MEKVEDKVFDMIEGGEEVSLFNEGNQEFSMDDPTKVNILDLVEEVDRINEEKFDFKKYPASPRLKEQWDELKALSKVIYTMQMENQGYQIKEVEQNPESLIYLFEAVSREGIDYRRLVRDFEKYGPKYQKNPIVDKAKAELKKEKDLRKVYKEKLKEFKTFRKEEREEFEAYKEKDLEGLHESAIRLTEKEYDPQTEMWSDFLDRTQIPSIKKDPDSPYNPRVSAEPKTQMFRDSEGNLVPVKK